MKMLQYVNMLEYVTKIHLQCSQEPCNANISMSGPHNDKEFMFSRSKMIMYKIILLVACQKWMNYKIS